MLTRAGYSAVTRSVRLSPSESQRLAVHLEPILGEVEITGRPADAELFVDGKLRGAANQLVKLPAVAQTIEVRKAGLETFRATITPRPGLRQAVAYELKSQAELHVAGTPRTRLTSLGQELRLMPAGSFLLGSSRREPGRRSNETQRPVELQRLYYLGTREVTNGEFRQFRAAHESGIFKQETLDLDRYPVVAISWQEAAEFCNWLSAKEGLPAAYVAKGGRLVLADPVGTGYRLPTEAEWEFAARWDGGRAERKYPWGSALPVPPGAGNFADTSAVYLQGVTLQGYNDGFRVAAPVGSFGTNPAGLFDMGGNVSEWTNDYYSIYPDQGGVVAIDPRGPADGQAYVIRGSNWLTANISELRLAYRDAGTSGRPTVGFRLARYAE
jgi:formylglycine-generating enzyme required for sulfatase activity